MLLVSAEPPASKQRQRRHREIAEGISLFAFHHVVMKVWIARFAPRSLKAVTNTSHPGGQNRQTGKPFVT